MKSPSAIYGLGVTVRNVLYNRGVRKTRWLRGPVVSVGNISVGGAGKTPFVIMLGELLLDRGIKFDVLSRGYGRCTRGAMVVDPAGSARDFGDEPLLIARRLNVPVIVGEDRYEAGVITENEFGPQLHLLDDGFQHRALHRDFDIVLVRPEDSTDGLLPSGRLREPVDSLRRADSIVVTNDMSTESFPLRSKNLWRLRRGIQVVNVPLRPVVFCGIARPQVFVSQLREAGIVACAEIFYRDHHSYSEDDIRRLHELRDETHAGGFVTTDKDAVNLGPLASSLSPLAVVPVVLELIDAADLIDTMLRTIEQRRRKA